MMIHYCIYIYTDIYTMYNMCMWIVCVYIYIYIYTHVICKQHIHVLSHTVPLYHVNNKRIHLLSQCFNWYESTLWVGWTFSACFGTWWLNDDCVPAGISGKTSPTLWLFNIAMDNDPFIDDFPMKTSIYSGFSMAMLNHQMVIGTVVASRLTASL